MQITPAKIAKIIGGEVVGDSQLVLKGISGIKEAQEGELTFVAQSKYFSLVGKTKASAIIAPKDKGLDVPGKTLILTDNPSLAFSEIISHFLKNDSNPLEGVHPTAVISDQAKVGRNVAIGPYAVIEAGAVIGNDSAIYSHCWIGQNVILGAGCLIYPNVSIREGTRIGQRVIVHSGAVIGADGFGFVEVDGKHQKIPQIGIVEVHDDVEIGANVTIDRARFDKTEIGAGTKIDNLVQIAHNVRIGRHCLIVSQVGISGSTVIEDNCILAGQAGLAGHLTIGAHSIVAAQCGVTNSIPPHSIVSGYPARPHQHAKRINAYVQRLPVYIKLLNDLKGKIQELEKRESKRARKTKHY